MPQHQLPGAAFATEDQRGRSGDVLRTAVHRVVLVDPTGQYPCFAPNALLRISKSRPDITHRGYHLAEVIVYVASAAQPASRDLVDALDVPRQHLLHPISIQLVKRRKEVGCDISQLIGHQTGPPNRSEVDKPTRWRVYLTRPLSGRSRQATPGSMEVRLCACIDAV